MPLSMAYTIEESKGGRYFVRSPAGKTWKTTYPNRTSAEKAIAYVEKRFGGTSSSGTSDPPTTSGYGEDTAQERKDLGVPPLKTEEEEESAEAGW